MRRECDGYRNAADLLSTQVSNLAELVILTAQQAQQREEALLKQLLTLQKALPDGLND